jgi:hypothetical protein
MLCGANLAAIRVGMVESTQAMGSPLDAGSITEGPWES